MPNYFADQFRVLPPYTPDRLATGTPSIGVTLPRKPPTEDPEKTPTSNPTSNGKSTPTAEPRTTGSTAGNSLWGNILGTAEKVGAGALGLGAAGVGASKLATMGNTVASDVKGAVSDAEPGLERAVTAVPKELPTVARGVGADASHLGSQFSSVAKSANSFLESEGGNGGLVGAVEGKTPAPATGLKVPDSIENIASDAADLLKGDFGLAA